MGEPKTKAPPGTSQPTPAAPPVCRGDLAVSDCKSAVIFSDHAPSFAASKPDNFHCDFKTVWAFVPAQHDPLSLLIYLHGNDNWCRVDGTGKGVVPDWAKDGDASVRVIPDPDDPERNPAKKRKKLVLAQQQVSPGVFKDVGVAPVKYELAAASEANKKPIVLAPECADPVVHKITTE